MYSFALELRATLSLSPDTGDEAVLEAVRALVSGGSSVCRHDKAAVPDVVRKAFGEGGYPDVATTPL